ncbi:unnamed protein product [Rangifer tarandus platyrhynchus]|uniref:Uncharacterized protein n=1 Tax=Rangifer tarandus platyrhynchus TaxID=3082113 RepID=A0ABN8Z4Y3_RANTA|nr:unnamed protein product [Rangifer tarandus platyrhynchus]
MGPAAWASRCAGNLGEAGQLGSLRAGAPPRERRAAPRDPSGRVGLCAPGRRRAVTGVPESQSYPPTRGGGARVRRARWRRIPGTRGCDFTSPGGAPRESRFSAPQTALLKSLHPGLETRQKGKLRLETPGSVGDCAESWSAWLEEKGIRSVACKQLQNAQETLIAGEIWDGYCSPQGSPK